MSNYLVKKFDNGFNWTPRFTEGWAWTPRGKKIVAALNLVGTFVIAFLVACVCSITY